MAFALRILLGLLLVLNGVGVPPAAAHMAQAAGDRHGATEHCAPNAHHAGHVAANTEQDRGDHVAPDCCGSAACHCACAHAASTALFAFGPALPPFGRGAPAAVSPYTRAAPALPTPLRPPIA